MTIDPVGYSWTLRLYARIVFLTGSMTLMQLLVLSKQNISISFSLHFSPLPLHSIDTNHLCCSIRLPHLVVLLWCMASPSLPPCVLFNVNLTQYNQTPAIVEIAALRQVVFKLELNHLSPSIHSFVGTQYHVMTSTPTCLH